VWECSGSFGSVCFAPSCSAKGSFRWFSHQRGCYAFDCLCACITSLPPDVPHLGSHSRSTRRSRSEDLSSILHDEAAIDPTTSATPCPASPPVLDRFASPLAVGQRNESHLPTSLEQILSFRPVALRKLRLIASNSCNSSHHQRFMRETFFKNEISENISQKFHDQWKIAVYIQMKGYELKK